MQETDKMGALYIMVAHFKYNIWCAYFNTFPIAEIFPGINV